MRHVIQVLAPGASVYRVRKMLKRVAVIVDWANLLYAIRGLWEKRKRQFLPAPDKVIALIKDCLEEEEELFRILFYDCPPLSETVKRPVSGEDYDFTETDTYKQRAEFLNKIKVLGNVAFRKGQARFRGWLMKSDVRKDLLKRKRNLSARSLTDADFQPNIQQKGVDIKMGLDMAWLALQGVVERVFLFSADTDLVPAMKFARIHGLYVIVADAGGLHEMLKEHADEVRTVDKEKIKNLPVMAEEKPKER